MGFTELRGREAAPQCRLGEEGASRGQEEPPGRSGGPSTTLSSFPPLRHRRTALPLYRSTRYSSSGWPCAARAVRRYREAPPRPPL